GGFMKRELKETTELLLDKEEFNLIHRAMERVNERTKKFLYSDISSSNLYALSQDAKLAFMEVVPHGRKFLNRADTRLYEFKYIRVHVDKVT
ncbi:hypothetical protein PJM52_29110, partial [Mycobacterium kansasii]